MADVSATPITRIADIRRLSREDAARFIPVRISGVCVYVSGGEMVVHDGSHGIWVSSGKSAYHGFLSQGQKESQSNRVGTTVEIEGVTDPGGYAPQVLPSTIRRTGEASLPSPRRITAEQLIAGSEDGQYVELEGIVQSVEALEDRTVCSLVAEGVNCLLALHGEARQRLPQLVDARVRVRGIFAPNFNSRSEAVLPKVISSASESYEVLEPPPADPFSAPVIPLDQLLAFSPDASIFHRRVTTGLVTFVQPGVFFFLRDGNTSIRVSSAETGLHPGWRVEVAGFVDSSQHFAALKNGIVRKLGEGALPASERVSAEVLLQSATRSLYSYFRKEDLSGRKVILRGRIRRVERATQHAPVAVWLEEDEHLFSARLPQGAIWTRQQSETWLPGAEAEFTGVSELEFSKVPDPLGLYQPTGFHVWLSSPEDLTIVRSPSWWTPERSLIVFTGGFAILALSLAWSWTLRHRVKKQAFFLARELEQKAVATERERMARDLHDTLEQHLTGVAMQLESLAKSAQSQSPVFAERLALSSRMIQHSREEARRSVWDLRNLVLENHGLAAALQSLAASVAIDGGPAVETRIESGPAELPPAIAYQLLRMAQEALSNSLKHANAAKILITMGMTDQHCVLVVSDDGLGFDSHLVNLQRPPHFGLIGMRERALKIGATLEITSQPGTGCAVTITIPIVSP